MSDLDSESPFWCGSGGNPPFNSEKKPISKILPHYVFGGRIDEIPPPRKGVVKIFLSSTFKDMYVERNYLLENVFPRLTKYCKRQYNLEFQVVDMRWGVRDEATNDHSGPLICMSELQSCRELSFGPNFVCLLGQRYGSRPLQTKIDHEEFKKIKSELIELSEREENVLYENNMKKEHVLEYVKLLDETDGWYRLEENQTPPQVLLNPLDYMNCASRKDFEPIETKLHAALRIGAERAFKNGKLTEEQLRKYVWSVTEEEIFRGVLCHDDQSIRNQALCFQRTLNITDEVLEKAEFELLNKFIDVKHVEKNGKKVTEVDQEVNSLVNNLIKETRDKLGDDNFVTFPTQSWCENGGTNEDFHKDYLKQLGEMFYEKVKMLIDRAATQLDPLAEHNFSNQLVEIVEHDHQAQAKVKTFQGRDDIIQKVKQYIRSTSRQPFVLYGDSGFGKTSLMAVASVKVFEWIDDTENLMVVRRFLGTTPESTNIGPLLYGIVTAIKQYFKCEVTPTDNSKKILHYAFMSLPDECKVVIFLDSLDQLSNYSQAHSLGWLPFRLPTNVKIILSTLPIEHGILSSLRKSDIQKQNFVEVSMLAVDLSMKLIHDWLTTVNRKLTTKQTEIVEQRFEEDENTSPLYIKLIFDVVKRTNSFEDDEKFAALLQSINSPVNCIRRIFTELMKSIGPLLVHRLFSYLHHSNGLTENELIDLISLDDEVLNDVFQYHAPPLRRLPATFWARIRSQIHEYLVTRESNGGKVIAWYHRQFKEVGDKMFKYEVPWGAPGSEYQKFEEDDEEKPPRILNQQTKVKTLMVEYFKGVWAAKPKPFEYPEEFAKQKKIEQKSEALRYVPPMPNLLEGGKPNRRKLGQLPQLFIQLNRITELFDEVFGDIGGLIGLFAMFTWGEVGELMASINFNNLKAIGVDKDDFQDTAGVRLYAGLLLAVTLRCGNAVLYNPTMLGPLLTGQLLPYAAASDVLMKFIEDIFVRGSTLNSFVSTHTQLEGVGNYLLFELVNVHEGPCVAMEPMMFIGEEVFFFISRRAVVMNSDHEIVMNYQPSDMAANDSFHLMEKLQANSEEQCLVAVSLQLKPKVYILDFVTKDSQGVVDCRKVEGCEDMKIKMLRTTLFKPAGHFVIVSGEAHHGVLVFNAQELVPVYRFCNQHEVLFIDTHGPCDVFGPTTRIMLTQSHKTLILEGEFEEEEYDVKETEETEPEEEESEYDPIKEQNKLLDPSKKFTTMLLLDQELPSPAVVTQKGTHYFRDAYTSNDDQRFFWQAFATTDSCLYLGCIYIPSFENKSVVIDSISHNWKIIQMESPVVSICIGPRLEEDSPDSTSMRLGVCTEEHAYTYTCHLDTSSLDEIRIIPNSQLNMKMSYLIPRISSISQYQWESDRMLGYYLGEFFVFSSKLEHGNHSDSDLKVQVITRKMLSVVGHSRPIVSIGGTAKGDLIYSVDVGGTLRLFRCGVTMSEELQALTHFDRMDSDITSISCYNSTAAVLSKDNSDVVLWSVKDGKINGRVCPKYEDCCVIQAIIIDNYLVTLSNFGSVIFWKYTSDEWKDFQQFDVVDFREMVSCGFGMDKVFIVTKKSWFIYAVSTGDLCAGESFEELEILQYMYINNRVSLLTNDLDGNITIIIKDIRGSLDRKIQLKQDSPYKDVNETALTYYCYGNILVVSYINQVIMYNIEKNTIIQTLPMYKARFVISQTGVFVVRNSSVITTYRIQEGNLEKLSSSNLSRKSDQVFITPNGRTVVILEDSKMLKAFNSYDLSDKSMKGIYSLYTDAVCLHISDDSNQVIMGLVDRRIFILLLADQETNADLIQNLVKEMSSQEYIEENAALAHRLMTQTLNNYGDYDKLEESEMTDQLNILTSKTPVSKLLKEGERLSVLHKMMTS